MYLTKTTNSNCLLAKVDFIKLEVECSKFLPNEMQLKHLNRPGVANRLIASTGRSPSFTWSIAPDCALN